MKTIEKNIINEIVINKSRFITILKYIDSKEVKNIINKYKKIYPRATHYCYGYIIDNYYKCDDDKEPGGTAGIPILNVLQSNNLTNVICIVIRYFGGIKLGKGGLAKAYSKSVEQALKKSKIVSLVKGFKMEVEFTYNDTKTINFLLKNIEIEKEYNDKIIYRFCISEEEFEKIKNLNFKIIKKEPILLKV